MYKLAYFFFIFNLKYEYTLIFRICDYYFSLVYFKNIFLLFYQKN